MTVEKGSEHTPLRMVRFSLSRQCPRCVARSIYRERPHHYLCDACRCRFVGFQIGPIRVAINLATFAATRPQFSFDRVAQQDTQECKSAGL